MMMNTLQQRSCSSHHISLQNEVDYTSLFVLCVATSTLGAALPETQPSQHSTLPQKQSPKNMSGLQMAGTAAGLAAAAAIAHQGWKRYHMGTPEETAPKEKDNAAEPQSEFTFQYGVPVDSPPSHTLPMKRPQSMSPKVKQTVETPKHHMASSRPSSASMRTEQARIPSRKSTERVSGIQGADMQTMRLIERQRYFALIEVALQNLFASTSFAMRENNAVRVAELLNTMPKSPTMGTLYERLDDEPEDRVLDASGCRYPGDTLSFYLDPLTDEDYRQKLRLCVLAY